MEDSALDFALAAWREEGVWNVSTVPPRAAETVESLAHALRQLPGEGGVLGFVSVAEEFFLLLRVQGDTVRLLLSDLNTAYDWPLAEDAADRLGIELPEDDDELDDIEPAGDLTVLADLGMDAAELEMLCTDPDLYPDEQVGSIAGRVGFSEQLKSVLEDISAD